MSGGDGCALMALRKAGFWSDNVSMVLRPMRVVMSVFFPWYDMGVPHERTITELENGSSDQRY